MIKWYGWGGRGMQGNIQMYVFKNKHLNYL